MAGDFRRAREFFDDVAKNSKEASVVGIAARGLIAAGGDDLARAAIAPFIASGHDDPEVAITAAELADDQDDLDRSNARLEIALDRASPSQRMTVLFALAEVNHRRGDFDRAFAHATEANALKKARFDAPAEAALVERIIKVTGQPAPNLRVNSTNKEPRMIFVLGMQRAGLRLVESILAAHPDVAGLGGAGAFQATVNRMGQGAFGYLDTWNEMTEADLATTVDAHLARIRKRTDAETAVEALPGNLFHVGLIHRLFPNARFVLCQRSPLDRCLSCFFQDFAGASPYAYDLENLGRHSRSVDRLVEHWRDQANLPVTEVDFDALINEPEATARRLFETLGISWHASAAAQVDSRRVSWRKRHTDYLHLLNPLISALEPKEA